MNTKRELINQVIATWKLDKAKAKLICQTDWHFTDHIVSALLIKDQIDKALKSDDVDFIQSTITNCLLLNIRWHCEAINTVIEDLRKKKNELLTSNR